jgi:phosphoglycolate phosphatase
VLFDLDGTLIDTAPEFIHIGLQLRAAAGLAPMSGDIIRQSVSGGAIGMVQTALELSATDPQFETWRQQFLTLYEAELGQYSAPYPGLVELIAELHGAGVSWGVVTNKLERFAAPLMKRMPFDPPAGAVITPDHVAQPKPDPEAILLACKHLGASPKHSLFIGDHLRDIEAGKSAGCYTIAAAYGYLAAEESASLWGADAVALSSKHLADLIRGQLF